MNTGKTIKLDVDSKLLTGFFDGDSGKVNSYWGTETVGSDGQSYYYPHNDSYEVDDKLVLSFARLILAVDTNKQTFLGGFALTDPEYNVVSTSFWFHSKEMIPLVVVESGWEGVSKYNALVDLSGEKIKVEKIESLDKTGFGLFDLKKITWENGGVTLSLYAEEDVSNKVSDITKSIKNYEDIQEIKAAEDKALARLRQDKSYYDVKCMLSPGIIAGCFAALNPVTYYYKPGGPLQKI